jgi:hypothetical protein
MIDQAAFQEYLKTHPFATPEAACRTLDEEALKAELAAANARAEKAEAECVRLNTVINILSARADRAEKAEAERDDARRQVDALVGAVVDAGRCPSANCPAGIWGTNDVEEGERTNICRACWATYAKQRAAQAENEARKGDWQ